MLRVIRRIIISENLAFASSANQQWSIIFFIFILSLVKYFMKNVFAIASVLSENIQHTINEVSHCKYIQFFFFLQTSMGLFFFFWIFWWRQLAAGRSLKCASCRGGWGERSCPRSVTAIHSVAADRPPNLPIGRRTLKPLCYCRPSSFFCNSFEQAGLYQKCLA